MVEWDRGNSEVVIFTQLYKAHEETYDVTALLKQGKDYRFKVYADNMCGVGQYSDIGSYTA